MTQHALFVGDWWMLPVCVCEMTVRTESADPFIVVLTSHCLAQGVVLVLAP